MATQRALPQSKESLLQNYNKRLKDDIRSILDNFTEIIKTAKVRLYCVQVRFSSLLSKVPLCKVLLGDGKLYNFALLIHKGFVYCN